MARPTDPRFLVLHELRVKGLADLAGRDAGIVHGLEADGMIERRDGVVSGWRLTAGGRAAHQDGVARDVDGLEDGLFEVYRRFLALNPVLLGICTAWQGPGVGEREGRAVLERLEALHAAAVPVLDGLARLLSRYASYRQRLATALHRVRAGEADYVTRPLVDSYHTVWSELHEDLLASLGIARGSEPVAETEVA